MNKEKFKKELQNGLIAGLLAGLIFALLLVSMDQSTVIELSAGVFYGFIGGLALMFIASLFMGLLGVSGVLLVGLSGGYSFGLAITFATNLIALLLDNPDFVMFDLVSSGIALLIIQVVGWTIVWRLRNE